jgi:hypothetical protein
VLSPCVTYNDTYPQWEATLHDLDATDHDATDRTVAFDAVSRLGEAGRMAVGMIYRNEAAAPPVEFRPHPAAADSAPQANAEAYGAALDRYRM